MNTHSIDLVDYRAQSRGNSILYLGTAGSHGNEQLQVTQGKGWEGLTVQVVFHPCKVAVQLPANGVLDVPWEATARPLTAMQGRIVFQGFDQDRLVNSTDLAYTVASHSPTLGRDEQPYTPGIVEGVLNQMAADKDAILQAAQQTGQAKEAAAASAAAAASSAANAQQSAGAANTSAGQAADSASQAAGSAAAANETLTQLQTAGQEAQQKVKDAETEALGNISAAAPALPAVSAAAAWQSVTAKPDGTGYNLAAMAPIEATIRPTVTGNPAVCKDSAAWAFQGLKIYGKSTQDGTPSPENPVPIVSAGDVGRVVTTICGSNLLDLSQGKSGTGEGVTFTKNSDGSYQMVGTATGGAGNVWFLGNYAQTKAIFYLQPGTYYARDCVLFNDKKSINSSSTIEKPFIVNETTPVSGVRNPQMSSGESYNKTIYPAIFVGETAQSWEPYKSQILTLSTPNGLPGIPVESGGNFTNADGQQLVCDVVEFDSKKIKLRCSITGIQNFYRDSLAAGTSGSRFSIKLTNLKTEKYCPVLCNYFPFSKSPGYDIAGNYITTNESDTTKVSIRITEELSISEFKEKFSDLKIVYQLENPIETDIPDEELAAYRALTTYDGTTVVSTAEPVAGIEASYVMDGNKYRESVDKRLAALEAAQTGI